MSNSFDTNRTGTGTAEWADVNENICSGCANGCHYCYARSMAHRFGRRDRSDWTTEKLTERANMTRYPSGGSVVMFPSTHDITPVTVAPYIRVARLILEKGNQLLIVSKPRTDCIRKVVKALVQWRHQILFRFTIGTLNNDLAAFWEPGAPSPSERFNCLEDVFSRGFKTSVSMEPILGDVVTVVDAVEDFLPWVTDTIWIGKMNRIRNCVDMALPGMREAVDQIEAQQTDEKILWLVNQLQGQPKVRWKDSIKEVIARNPPQS